MSVMTEKYLKFVRTTILALLNDWFFLIHGFNASYEVFFTNLITSGTTMISNPYS